DWAIERRNWGVEDFEGVIWSDECSVEHTSDSRQVWVFREPPKTWLEECVHPKAGKQTGTSLMIWGCFWGENKGPLVCLDNSVTKVTYLKLLRRYLPPIL